MTDHDFSFPRINIGYWPNRPQNQGNAVSNPRTARAKARPEAFSEKNRLWNSVLTAHQTLNFTR